MTDRTCKGMLPINTETHLLLCIHDLKMLKTIGDPYHHVSKSSSKSLEARLLEPSDYHLHTSHFAFLNLLSDVEYTEQPFLLSEKQKIATYFNQRSRFVWFDNRSDLLRLKLLAE